MEYMIIIGSRYGSEWEYSFDFAMQKALEEGWRPQGGICLDANGRFMQAMTRESAVMPHG